MAKYKALLKSFIDGHLREPGDEFEFDGIPGSSLEPLDDEAMEAKAKSGRASKPVRGTAADTDDADIQVLRDQYRELFGEDPHPAKKSARLRQDIADKRQELGV